MPILAIALIIFIAMTPALVAWVRGVETGIYRKES
jgi:hypothetical protein